MGLQAGVDGKQIAEYLGIVSGETILGANFIRDIAASITDLIGQSMLMVTGSGTAVRLS